MRKIFIFTLSVSLFVACGKSKSAKQIAEEVCDCSKKANDLPTSDTTRSKAQNDCLVLQREGWDKVKADMEKAKEFNDVLSKCASEQIKKSFGE